MTSLNTYNLGATTGITSVDYAVSDAIEQPRNTEACVYVTAPTKAAAIQVLADHGFPYRKPRDLAARPASGDDVDGLRVAGLFDQPGVVVTPRQIGRSGRVVRMQAGGVPVPVGRLVPVGDLYQFEADA